MNITPASHFYYTARLWDMRWLRARARRKNA
ncbi:NinE family protein [Klebsiella quasivariicola]|nr:NinE family protein [Klebsiella quasivariicola]